MKMRLAKDNIRHVVITELNDNAYDYFVAMKSNRVSDCRRYYSGNENVAFPFNELPKCVQKFLMDNNVKKIRGYNIDGITQRVYKNINDLSDADKAEFGIVEVIKWEEHITDIN